MFATVCAHFMSLVHFTEPFMIYFNDLLSLYKILKLIYVNYSMFIPSHKFFVFIDRVELLALLPLQAV